ncbi:hypothetical protein OH76DRAFT_1398578 [Lentinus brumalis]|uniref:Uncharacterized protein n=1 Tax=Lentinus brumalis TaxID=2498619 RepID=A0A371DP30_9APHY|nr:hypothetical protein OH76DRAFT_1398578 [Polyporus brumalis]
MACIIPLGTLETAFFAGACACAEAGEVLRLSNPALMRSPQLGKSVLIAEPSFGTKGTAKCFFTRYRGARRPGRLGCCPAN